VIVNARAWDFVLVLADFEEKKPISELHAIELLKVIQDWAEERGLKVGGGHRPGSLLKAFRPYMKVQSQVTTRRIMDGEKAFALPEPKNKKEAAGQLDILSDGIRALQSLDDLGCTEANNEVMFMHDTLMKKYKRLLEEYKDE